MAKRKSSASSLRSGKKMSDMSEPPSDIGEEAGGSTASSPNRLTNGVASLDWTQEEKVELLDALKKQAANSDRVSFSAQLKKVDWEKVTIDGRSAQDCQDAWQHMSAKIRKFRTMNELLFDAHDMVINPDKYLDKKSKQAKHPDQPTKPLSAYFRFLEEHRMKLKRKHPELSNVDLARKLSDRWKSMGSKQDKYVQRYKEEWEQYKEANAKFLEDHPEMNKNLPKPKRPSPFMFFCKSRLDSFKTKHPEMDNITARNKLRRKYQKLSGEKKKKWIKVAEQSVPEYEEAIRKYQIHHPDFEPPAKKLCLTREEAVLNGDIEPTKKVPKKKFAGAPKLPPRSAFMLYMKKKLRGMEGKWSVKMKEVSSQWQALGDDKRKKYQEKSTKKQAAYKEALKAYKQTLSPEDLVLFEQSLKPKKRAKKGKTEDKMEEGTEETEKTGGEKTGKTK